MRAFEVRLNDKRLRVAGVDEYGILITTVIRIKEHAGKNLEVSIHDLANQNSHYP
jgi:hypothetical protein